MGEIASRAELAIRLRDLGAWVEKRSPDQKGGLATYRIGFGRRPETYSDAKPGHFAEFRGITALGQAVEALELARKQWCP